MGLAVKVDGTFYTVTTPVAYRVGNSGSFYKTKRFLSMTQFLASSKTDSPTTSHLRLYADLDFRTPARLGRVRTLRI